MVEVFRCVGQAGCGVFVGWRMFTDHFKKNHSSELEATRLVPAGILWQFSLSDQAWDRMMYERVESVWEKGQEAKRRSSLLPSQSSAFWTGSNSGKVDFVISGILVLVNQSVAAIQEEHCRPFDLLPCSVLPVQWTSVSFTVISFHRYRYINQSINPQFSSRIIIIEFWQTTIMFRNTRSFSRLSPSSVLMLLLLLCDLSSTVAFRSSGLQLQQRSSFVVSTTRQVSYYTSTKQQQQPQQTYTKQQQYQHRRSRSSSSELNMFMGSDGGILGVGTPEVVRHTMLC